LAEIIGNKKIEPLGYHTTFFMILCLAILVQCRLVKDGRTERPTHVDSIYHTSIASRGKKQSSIGHLKIQNLAAL